MDGFELLDRAAAGSSRSASATCCDTPGISPGRRASASGAFGSGAGGDVRADAPLHLRLLDLSGRRP